MTYEPSSVSPIELGAGILRDFTMGCIRANNADDAVNTFHEAANSWARGQLRDKGYRPDAIEKLFEEHEEHENMPIYDDYYSSLSQYSRKVFTAAANQ